ncbi:TonB family protein [Rudaea sp.]|uniref:energy transducer TonB n=1 Tax=Rudaea sp. TaxID=2136325 RepID=UPI002ED47866
MAQSEQFVSRDARPADGPTRKDLYYPGLVILVALAFAANAWFFYRQGQKEALSDGSEALPSATIAWTRPEESSPATAAQANSDAAQQPGATANDTAKPASVDAPTADKAPVKRTTRARPTNRTMLAKATPQATHSAPIPSERSVALLTHPKPAYPAPALRERQQGTVVVMAKVDVAGRVSDAEVVRRSGSFTLDRAAMNEVRRWKFEPALHNGQPVVASVEVPVSYRLGD